ncbi:MAG TPA: c-type cytochrome [Candidatus Binatia bacterium]|nr:c-type cytochrome [Candidatus Binatia bacterium]
MDITSVIVGVILGILALTGIVLALRGRLNALFLALSALLLVVVGIAVIRDTQARGYIAIQQEYAAEYGASFNIGVQQLFPSMDGSFEGSVYKVERCISCHVPDINEISPQQAAERIACDFFTEEPDAQALAKEYGLKSTYNPATGQCISQHPTMIVESPQDCPAGNVCMAYDEYGPNGTAAAPTTGKPLTYTAAGTTYTIPGFLPSNVDPTSTANSGLGGQETLQEIGCIVCHNGSRLALTESDAHENLIINPVYSWQEGAQLYYSFCAVCHGGAGQGGVGPPLNDQNELGFYNEDFYYRCIEYGMTGFEHYGSIMPNWGGIAPGYDQSAHPPGIGPNGQPVTVNQTRVLSETQIQILIQFIRHWEQYDTLP